MFHLALYLSRARNTTMKPGWRAGRYDSRLDPDDFAAPGDTDAERVRAAAEQVGQILKPEKVPVQVTVIDHVERPSAN